MKFILAPYFLAATALLFPSLILAQEKMSPGHGIFEGSTDIGATLQGATEYVPESGEYHVAGGGADMWGVSDDFHFSWIRLSGDVTLTADIRFPKSSTEALRKAVLMVRQSLDPGSAYADAAIHGDGHINLQFRAAAQGKTDDTLSPEHGATRLRIERKGNLFTVFAGEPGRALTPAPSMTIVMKDPVYVGIGVCAHNANAVEDAIFSSVKIEQHSQQGLTEK